MRKLVVGAITLTLAAACSSAPDHPPATTGGGGTTPVGPAPGPSAPPSTTASPGTPTTSWGADKCSAVPAGRTTGVGVGEQLPRLTLKDCDDNDYSLQNVCGASATWLFVAYAWCGPCKAVTGETAAIATAYTGKNVAFVNVLTQNASAQPPTAADCKAWKKTFGLDGIVTLYDPKGAIEVLNESGGTTLSVFLDQDRIIRSKSYSDQSPELRARLDEALTPR